MSRSTYVAFTEQIKSKVANLVINFNLLEASIKEILVAYVGSKKEDFVRDILFNNSIVSFHAKLNLLKFIVHKEKAKVSIDTELHRLISIRNAIAHSDNVYNMEGDIVGYDIVDEEYGISLPIYEPYPHGPKIILFNNGKINEEGLDNLVREFNEKLSIAEKGLDEIKNALFKG